MPPRRCGPGQEVNGTVVEPQWQRGYLGLAYPIVNRGYRDKFRGGLVSHQGRLLGLHRRGSWQWVPQLNSAVGPVDVAVVFAGPKETKHDGY